MATALLGLALGSSLLRLVFDAARVNDFGGILALLDVNSGIVLIMRDMKSREDEHPLGQLGRFPGLNAKEV